MPFFQHILKLSVFWDSSLQSSRIFIEATVNIFLSAFEGVGLFRHVVDLFIEGRLLCDGTNSCTERSVHHQ